MFHLCSITSSDLQNIMGNSNFPNEHIQPKYENLSFIMIGQKIENSAAVGYLILTETLVPEFTKHNSVPEGYEFTFKQEWGLTINEDMIHKTIETLRKESYPPMSDYIDAIVKNDENQKNDYLNKCLVVKTKYPKFSFNV
jgi:hypothetical protein